MGEEKERSSFVFLCHFLLLLYIILLRLDFGLED